MALQSLVRNGLLRQSPPLSAMGSQLEDGEIDDDDEKRLPFAIRLDTADSALFSDLCERYMHPEPMPALASRTIPAAMVHNVVGSVWYGCMVESGRIQRYLPSAYVHNFTSVVIRWANPYITMLLFSNGFAVVVGAMSPEEFLYAVHLGRHELEAMGYRPTLRYFSVDNTVASGHVPFNINLEECENDNCCLEYDPNVFPGGILTVYEPHSVALLFTSGSFMLTGLRSRADCYTVYCHILEFAERFRASDSSGKRGAKKKASTVAAAAAMPTKRKAQARESKRIMNRMDRESAYESTTTASAMDEDEPAGSPARDGDDNNNGHKTEAAPMILTKAQHKEFLRRAHICSRGVRGLEKIQGIHRMVLEDYKRELHEDAARKAAAKAERNANAEAKRARNSKKNSKPTKAAEAAAAPLVVTDERAVATLSAFVDPQTLKRLRDTSMPDEVMEAMEQYADEYDAL